MSKRNPEIFCPKCGWRPKPDSRWQCTPGCGAVWHTFWTAGTCPGCAHHWDDTQCLSCKKVSPHQQWYHFPPEDQAPAKRKRKSVTA